MPRRPREHVDGAIYHVYNQLARGAEVFADRREAERFLDLLVEMRDRDGLTILAWCVMSNHYHLALRAGELAAVLGKRPEVITRWAAWAGKRRRSDGAFRRRYEELDEILCYPSTRRRNSGRLS